MKIKLFSTIILFTGAIISSFSFPNDSIPYGRGRIVKNNITFEYSGDLIHSQDRIRKGWAKRNDIYVLSIRLLNNSDKPIHGSQFELLNNGEKLVIIDNKLASKKLKTKKPPKALYIIPVTAIVLITYYGIKSWIWKDGDYVDDGISDEPWLIPIKKKDPKLNYIQNLFNEFNLAEQIVFQGESIEGLIAVKSNNPIQNMDILIKEVDFEIYESKKATMFKLPL